jgi:membrane dipeptidase
MKYSLIALMALFLFLTACEAQPRTNTRSSSALTARMTDGGRVLMPLATRKELIAQDPMWREALRIHYNAIVMDGHIDVPTLMVSDPTWMFKDRHAPPQHVDLPRMFEGGLDAPIFSIFVSESYPEGLESRNRAREEINRLKEQMLLLGDQAQLARTADEVRRITKSGKKAILMGIEGGHALAGLAGWQFALKLFADEGVRYVTLTHVNTNSFADASQTPPQWGGLNDKGRDVVREMNRLGILVDISHVSDETFWDALEVSQAPLIASHSACRELTENVRNMRDEMIKALAQKGGVMMINYMEGVVNQAMTKEVAEEVHRRVRDEHNGDYRTQWQVITQVRMQRGIRTGTIDDLIDHIDHAVKIAGIDHVGLGSDFDGATMPDGLEDVTKLPYITYKLLKRGYKEADLYKILGGNTLRVLEEAEQVSKRLQGSTTK